MPTSKIKILNYKKICNHLQFVIFFSLSLFFVHFKETKRENIETKRENKETITVLAKEIENM